MESKLQDLKSLLATKNYKLTSQRKLILQILLDHQGEHLSAEDIYQIVKQEDSGIGLATVYRTLELFSDLGIIQQLNFDEDRRRYELGTNNDEHHHHLVCEECGRVIEFNDEILEAFEDDLADKHNFKITQHRIKFYGRCKECQ
ncbi:Fe2+/Zn2+ uptake regulation protein [Halobacteroides halobius DSM 5150]|uniref:Fe2+/Zn2+ uptake regulation protein n=1 Tax=Halobacteroides halobius (strain ATCC 35273 / DSM 5150 / MD-1) TaxID=748449 RepID=L0KBL8_HALHC|nr:Fur family transcriptional regulator [Halobacteroides halobius]AGB41935.1 Fe2+/Zn2+ uptake regulation protein [Halobacteroides halobius DSM 5150]